MDYENSYKNISPIRAILLFIFSHKRFINLSIKHDAGSTIVNESDLRKKYFAGEYSPDEEKLEENATNRTIDLRKSFAISGLAVLGAILFAYLSSIVLEKSVGVPTDTSTKTMQTLGAAFLLWPTRLGLEVIWWTNATRTRSCLDCPFSIRIRYLLYFSVNYLVGIKVLSEKRLR